MKWIDLDDLPPKVAAQLAGAEAGEQVLLVRGGAVVARLTASPPEPGPEPEPEGSGEERAAEIFEQFRAIVEDEF
jgi:antitoxin (DNA-binding transcriptional repressor) of toxin-antitoxin stability system